MSRHIAVVLLAISVSFPSAPGAEKPPTVTLSQLLARYAETQDQAQSYVLKVLTVRTGSASDQTGELTVRGATTYTEKEVHYDGRRVKEIRKIWGFANSLDRDVPKERPIYVSYLWDGKDLYQYSTNTIPGRPPRLTLHRNKKDVVPSAFAHDSLNDNKGGRRIDVVLREAETVSLRENRESIGGSSCYVIDAVTKDDKFTVWMDPEHGYNPAQLLWVHESPGGKLSWREFRKNVRFERIDGVWIPMEGDIETAHWATGYSARGGAHVKRTQFLRNPDHEALRSFLPDDVANGSRVVITDVPGIAYTWQDGRIIPDAATLTPQDLLARYAATQARLRSFSTKGESRIEREHGPGQEPLWSTHRDEFRTDGERVAYSVRQEDAADGADPNAAYRSLLWNGEYLLEYYRGHGRGSGIVAVVKTRTGRTTVMAREYDGAALLGFCAGDDERVDAILRQAHSLTLAPQMEEVRGVPCHVLEATTDRGTYRVWIDPRHGYNLARMEVRRDKNATTAEAGPRDGPATFVMKEVDFQNVDGVWVPMQATLEQVEASGRRSWHHRRTEMVINPNHDERRSFVLEGVGNGTRVVVAHEPNVPYVWQNGTFVRK
jgi:hypothetical protein